MLCLSKATKPGDAITDDFIIFLGVFESLFTKISSPSLSGIDSNSDDP